jgi:hypothetical protein
VRGRARRKCAARETCAKTRPRLKVDSGGDLAGFWAASYSIGSRPAGPYFADFTCREQKLVIEVDGRDSPRATLWLSAETSRVKLIRP